RVRDRTTRPSRNIDQERGRGSAAHLLDNALTERIAARRKRLSQRLFNPPHNRRNHIQAHILPTMVIDRRVHQLEINRNLRIPTLSSTRWITGKPSRTPVHNTVAVSKRVPQLNKLPTLFRPGRVTPHALHPVHEGQHLSGAVP